jgi:ankyrin repeat protein
MKHSSFAAKQMTRIRAPISVFLGGPNSPQGSDDLLLNIKEFIANTYNSAGDEFSVNVSRWNEPPDSIQVEPGISTQDIIDKEINVANCDIVIMAFRDRLGSRHPDPRFPSYSAYELQCAIEARRNNKDDVPWPVILIYKANKSWTAASDAELMALPPDQRKLRRDQDGQRQDDHIALLSYLGALKMHQENNHLYTVTEQYDDDKLLSQAKKAIRSTVSRFLAPPPDETRSTLRFDGWPYPGLRDFAIENWDIFKGRGDKIDEVFKAFDNGRKLVAIIGPSGTGKTSLLQAGIIGNLRYGSKKEIGKNWIIVEVEPEASGEKFLFRMAIKLENLLKQRFGSREASADRLFERLEGIFKDPPHGTQFDFEIARSEFQKSIVDGILGETGDHRRLVIVINQGEHAASSGAPDRNRFLRFVATAASCSRTNVLTTLRDDVFGTVRSDPIVEKQVRHLIEPIWLTAPDEHELTQMIEEPAQVAGLTIELRLVKRIRVDASERGGDASERGGGALPLVAQCLNVLCRKARDNTLDLSSYDSLGGLAGVVAGQTREMESLANRAVFEELFTTLVGPGPEGSLQRLSASRIDLEGKGIPRELIDKAVDARMLQEFTADEGSAIKLSHDILFHTWPTLAEWARAQRRTLESQRAIIDDALRWRRSGSDERNIRLSDDMLAELGETDLAAKVPEEYRQTIRDYISAARSKSARQMLVAAVNAGLPDTIRKSIAQNAILTPWERGEGVGQLRKQYWAAITGDDRDDEHLELATSDESEPLTRSLFRDGSLVNSCVTRGFSVLHLAALSGQTDLLRKLVLSFGADVSHRTERGGSLLSSAAYAGNREACIFLIDTCGVAAETLDRDGSSAALWAYQQGHLDLAFYLQSRGAPLDVTMEKGWNRLTEAVHSGQLEAVKAAVKAGFSPHQTNEYGLTPALIACQYLYADVLDYLLKEHGVDISVRTKAGATALDLACAGVTEVPFADRKSRSAAILQLLCPAIPVDQSGTDGERVLVHAVRGETVEFLEALLRLGANPDRDPPSAVTPLFEAVALGHRTVAEALLLAGADINVRDKKKNHCLHVAATRGDLDIVELLLGRKAIHVDPREEHGVTPLMIASRLGHIEIVEELLFHGADRHLRDSRNWDALVHAIRGEKIWIAELLLETKLKPKRSFAEASVNASSADPKGGTPDESR